MSVVDIDQVVRPFDAELPIGASRSPAVAGGGRGRPWWLVSVAAGLAFTALLVVSVSRGAGARWVDEGTAEWWVVTTVLHAPYVVILLFVLGGVIERVGYYWRGRAPESAGRLPAEYPTVCVQLPMFNEHAVARRVIEAASAMKWPRRPFQRAGARRLHRRRHPCARRGRLRNGCGRRREWTATCGTAPIARATRLVRSRRGGGRRTPSSSRSSTRTSCRPTDFLVRTIPHFYGADGELDDGLALVQTQWGHLEPRRVIADHGPIALGRRPPHAADVVALSKVAVRQLHRHGWRLESRSDRGRRRLARREPRRGLRTQLSAPLRRLPHQVREGDRRAGRAAGDLHRVQSPAEALDAGLGAAPEAAPSRRCCSGSDARLSARLHLVYHMCIAWQWPLWAIWTVTLPLMIYSGLWFGSLGTATGVILYLAPTASWAMLAAGRGLARNEAHLRRPHHASGLPPTLPAGPSLPRPQHRNAPAPVQLVRRRTRRRPSQRVRTNAEGSVSSHRVGRRHCPRRAARRHHHGPAPVRPSTGCAASAGPEQGVPRQDPLAIRLGGGLLRRPTSSRSPCCSSRPGSSCVPPVRPS